jgi:hypothetical protein
MSTLTLFKATDPDGNSFADAKIHWEVGKTTRHPSKNPMIPNDASTYLSASTEPADCTGFRWPCRLFEVEAIGKTLTGMEFPHKVAAKAFRVVRERDAFEALGPNGKAVAAFIERCKRLTADEARKLTAAWAAAWVAAGAAAWAAAGDAAWAAARDVAWAAARAAAGDAAWAAAGDAAWAAARDVAWAAAGAAAWAAAWDAARDVAGDAAWVILVKDKITAEQFDVLTKPWRDAGLELA